jgi:hypothetical protein
MARLLEDVGLTGCAVDGQIEQGHITVNCADCELPFRAAVSEMNSSAGGVTLAAATEKVAEDSEAGTFTELGTTSAALLAEIATVVPPAGLAADRATVHALPAPALSVVGLQTKPVTRAGATRFRVVVREEPFRTAVMVTV